MKKRFFVSFLAVALALLGSLASFATTSAHNGIDAPAGFSSLNGEVPGCPAAKHVGPYKVPAEGAAVFHPKLSKPPIKGGLVIVYGWWNNNNPAVVGKPWNHGQPSWDQTFVKVLIPAGVNPFRFVGQGGEYWQYTNNAACRHNAPIEFMAHGTSLEIHSWAELKQFYLVKVKK